MRQITHKISSLIKQDIQTIKNSVSRGFQIITDKLNSFLRIRSSSKGMLSSQKKSPKSVKQKTVISSPILTVSSSSKAKRQSWIGKLLPSLKKTKGEEKINRSKKSIKKRIIYAFRKTKAFFTFKKPVKTPTFLQMEATECGSICLSIVLAYYKHELTPDEARSACGVSRDGSKASHIVQAARKYNMAAQGYSIQDIEALKLCEWPCIIHWNFDHFVVFEGQEGQTFYINDPESGRRRIDFEEFNNNFTGIVLSLTPEKGFTQKKMQSALSQFFSFSLKRGIKGIIAAFLLSILQVLPTIMVAFAGKVFIDYILIKNMNYWFPQLLLILAGCLIFQSLFMALHMRLLTRLTMHFKLSLESLIVHKLFHLPLRFFDQRFSGDILYRLSAAQELVDLLSLDVMGALSNVFGIIIFSFVLSQLSPPLFLIMLAFIAARILVFYANRERIRETNIHYAQQGGKVAGIEMNGLGLMETLKAGNLGSVFFKNWAANHDILLNKGQIVSLVDQRNNIWLATLTGLMTIALLYRGTYLVMGGSLTIGTLMAFMTLSYYLDTPLMTLLGFTSKLEKVKASINRVNDILCHDGGPVGSSSLTTLEAHKTDLPSLKSEIVLKDVTFGYAPLDPPIFHNLNLVIAQGKTTAIVGVSGSGKSTISKIICGLYPISAGEILWDNVAIQDMTVEQRNRRISLVDQDIFLFDGTIRDNLTSWDKTVDDETLIQALKLAGLFEELLPRGLLNYRIGENGSNLSGGQRQRLEIACALVHKADLLILDEATSSLDMTTERHVFQSLSQLSVTTVIIAHRLSTIEYSDMIYVIDGGTVIQSGKHKELSRKPGVYKDLIKLEVEQ